MPKDKKPAWFKMYAHQRSLMDAMPDDVLGRAMKAAMGYFDAGATAQLPPLEGAVFAALKPFMDEATEKYRQDVENGKKSAEKRKAAKVSEPPLRSLKQKEKDKEKDKEKEKEEESIPAAKPRSPAFIPPDYDQVAAYCREKGFNIDPERFVNYYTCIGWKVGNASMRDWKAAVRNWNRKENTNAATEPEPARKLGIRI